MNKRLKELETLSVYYNEEEETWEFDREKFAELIIRECIAECWYDATPKQISDNIKMKFGVK